MKNAAANFVAGICLVTLLSALPPAAQSCVAKNLAITVDNQLELYLDGVRVTNLPNANSWEVADTAAVSASVRVIAIKGTDVGVQAGILASAGDDFVTDGSWKCTSQQYDGWSGASFDDSAWPAAYVIGSHGVAPWGKIAGISDAAKWIWTSKYIYGDASDKVVYCRKRYCSQPCISSCAGLANGDYQSCLGCDVYATCSNGYLYDNRPCALGPNGKRLVWDDSLKRCEYTSYTCYGSGSVPIVPGPGRK